MSEKLSNLYLRRDDLESGDKWTAACKPPPYKQLGVALELYVPASAIRELIEKFNRKSMEAEEAGTMLGTAQSLALAQAAEQLEALIADGDA